jgi:hypothetical protein
MASVSQSGPRVRFGGVLAALNAPRNSRAFFFRQPGVDLPLQSKNKKKRQRNNTQDGRADYDPIFHMRLDNGGSTGGFRWRGFPNGKGVDAGRGCRMVTSKAEEYRAKARECEERAGRTRDPFIKQQMIDIAQKWHTMAAYEDKYGR